jgi:regulator of protease activity HflC (stomatin/prohibitin superfamily)
MKKAAEPGEGKKPVPERRGRIWAVVLILVALFLGKSWITVPRATVAALYDPLHGGIQPYDLREGWHLVPPWATVNYFSVRTQVYTMSHLSGESSQGHEDAIQCQTAEGLGLNIESTVLFHIQPGDANKLWKAVGPNYVAVVVRPLVREAARVIVAEYPIMSVYSNASDKTEGKPGIDFYPGRRQEVETRIFERLRDNLTAKGITLERFLLRNVDYQQPEFERAIVDKQVAQQRIVTQQYEAEVQQIRAQANVLRAEGDAEAIRLKASALRVQPKIVQWEMVDKLPQDIEVILLPDKAIPMLDTRDALTATPAPRPPAPAPAPRPPG